MRSYRARSHLRVAIGSITRSPASSIPIVAGSLLDVKAALSIAFGTIQRKRAGYRGEVVSSRRPTLDTEGGYTVPT